jgi:hypothetical protein
MWRDAQYAGIAIYSGKAEYSRWLVLVKIVYISSFTVNKDQVTVGYTSART